MRLYAVRRTRNVLISICRRRQHEIHPVYFLNPLNTCSNWSRSIGLGLGLQGTSSRRSNSREEPHPPCAGDGHANSRRQPPLAKREAVRVVREEARLSE